MSTFPEITILFEDNDLAVVVKPPGVVVNRADTVSEPTLQEWWEERLKSEKTPVKLSDWATQVPDDFPEEYGTPAETFTERGGIVHRLDKETSGVMVLAKHPGSLAHLLRQFRVREVEKKYTCLVHGKFQFPEDTLSLPLARSTWNRTKFAVDADGRTAETQYKVTAFYLGIDAEKLVGDLEQQTSQEVRRLREKLRKSYQGFSLVECWPKTGRTHQIRVHMNHIKHPIVADETYLGPKRAKLDVLWCPRLFLHASELSVTHPRSGERIQLSAPLPTDLQKALTYLEPGE